MNKVKAKTAAYPLEARAGRWLAATAVALALLAIPQFAHAQGVVGGTRRAPMTAAASRVRWVGPWVAQSVPVLAARSAPLTASSAFPARVAAATTIATATGAATGIEILPFHNRHSGMVRQHQTSDAQLRMGNSRSRVRAEARPGMTFFRTSILQPIAGLEDPPHHDQADDQERQRHAEAEGHAHVGDLVEAPAEAADQIDHRIEQRDRAARPAAAC